IAPDARCHRLPYTTLFRSMAGTGDDAGKGREGEEKREGEMYGAGLSIVENQETQHEGQGGGVPDLKERPGKRHIVEQVSWETAWRARAGVRHRHEVERSGLFLKPFRFLVTHPVSPFARPDHV